MKEESPQRAKCHLAKRQPVVILIRRHLTRAAGSEDTRLYRTHYNVEWSVEFTG